MFVLLLCAIPLVLSFLALDSLHQLDTRMIFYTVERTGTAVFAVAYLRSFPRWRVSSVVVVDRFLEIISQNKDLRCLRTQRLYLENNLFATLRPCRAQLIEFLSSLFLARASLHYR